MKTPQAPSGETDVGRSYIYKNVMDGTLEAKYLLAREGIVGVEA